MPEHSERMVFMMAMLWAQQIMLGKKTFADVPRLLKDKVKEILSLPEEYDVSALIAIGHPAVIPAASERKPLSDVLSVRS